MTTEIVNNFNLPEKKPGEPDNPNPKPPNEKWKIILIIALVLIAIAIIQSVTILTMMNQFLDHFAAEH